MKVSFKTIVLSSVLLMIYLLGLSLWKVNFRSTKGARVTKFWLGIITSCIASTVAIYCLITVFSMKVPNMDGLSLSEISMLFDFFTKCMIYIQVPAVITPVWWYTRSWKILYETVADVAQVFFDCISKDFDHNVVNLKITKRIFPILLMYFVLVSVYIYAAKKVFYNMDGVLGVPWELVYATLITKMYVCACVLHLTIALKFVSSIILHVEEVLAKL